MPSKHNLRKGLLLCFFFKKSVAESLYVQQETYEDHAPLIFTCEYWFRLFKSGDFDIKDKERPRQSKKFEDEELEALLDEDSCSRIVGNHSSSHFKTTESP